MVLPWWEAANIGVSTGTILPCNSGTDRVDGYGWIWNDMDENSIRVVQDGRVEPVTGPKVSTASKMFINPPCNPTAVMVPGFQRGTILRPRD